MTAAAALATRRVVDAAGRARSQISTLTSRAPLLLRLTMAKGPEPWVDGTEVRVCLASGAAGPIGGDRLALDVEVGAHTTLVLTEVSATLLLPGPRGAQSRTRTTVRVGPGGTFVWLPETVIASAGCHHRTDITVELAPSARLLMREEVVLGRHAEPPGRLQQHVRVRRGGRPLYHQQLTLGPGAAGWDSCAVAGPHKALATALVVDPAWLVPPPARCLGRDAALLPLAGPAVLLSALAADSLVLRRAIDAGLTALGCYGTSPAGRPDNFREPPGQREPEKAHTSRRHHI